MLDAELSIYCRSFGRKGTGIDFYAKDGRIMAVWSNAEIPDRDRPFDKTTKAAQDEHNVSWIEIEELEKLLKVAKASQSKSQVLVFWTTGTEAREALKILDKTSFPSYIFEQLRNRSGRPGRGRLWNAEIDGLKDIDIPEALFGESIGYAATHNLAGIPIWKRHAHYVNAYGQITDLELNPYVVQPNSNP